MRSDGELLRAVTADGDRRAFEELYRRYAPWLTARMRTRCADAALVDDVVQETFLAVWRGTARWREDAAGANAMRLAVADRLTCGWSTRCAGPGRGGG